MVKVHLECEISLEDRDIVRTPGEYNRALLKVAQKMHERFMQEGIAIYKENVENPNYETLPKSARPIWGV